ncbi:class I SAM-dependent methyltransferase [uncultured Rhodoblastus sp.]|uniref:class I SAM-dependent methyltransferase n=1 Tax=uncultured Rhodoblastus sp. TaxID=543037 RepID=UPI0025F66692|nr:class I SAM-dependent methyltransferase [uncultured Rhodoblastus sp.]
MLATAFQTAAHVFDLLRGKRGPVHPMDKALRIETSGRVTRRALASGSKNDVHSVGYVGAHPGIVRKCLDLIGVEPEMTFIDIGCGKGRALAVACEYPFARLIGLELSPLVARVAFRNFAKLRRRDEKFSRVSILEGDASQPPFQPGCNVFFFYHPFTGEPVKTLIANFRRHFEANPTSKVWLICYNPVSFDDFDKCGLFTRFYAAKIAADKEDNVAGFTSHPYDSVIIYQSANAPMRDPLPGAKAGVVITIPGLGADVVNWV